ncbi:hypothetical protein L226DRAFT_367345 [Lentinus tigrinus ALCF2SS1-7]|uniref:uncharacterized protein n=1 Tax=Lentinus tigrinus ALCF2SS1-7 TaxID=1328758 RepID=UPI001165EEB9|nr:hypothetical protein L226DRAFT_367345 [Lentinus tigrinus ALCF2SS1-7]
MSPPSLGGQEAGAVRKLLADTMPSSVNLGLGCGWWERTHGRERGLKAIFGSASSEEANTSGAWSGVSELVIRVEEPERRKHVTNDLLVMILPLANSLTTFVLYWDRTSVPFDRASSDDGPGRLPVPAARPFRLFALANRAFRADGRRADACAALPPRQDPARLPPAAIRVHLRHSGKVEFASAIIPAIGTRRGRRRPEEVRVVVLAHRRLGGVFVPRPAHRGRGAEAHGCGGADVRGPGAVLVAQRSAAEVRGLPPQAARPRVCLLDVFVCHSLGLFDDLVSGLLFRSRTD